MSEQEHKTGHIINYGLLVAIWAGLLMLTGVTIWVAGLELGNFSTVTAMLIASCKALLVVFIFMHLKYETWVFKVIALISVAVLTIIILMTFTDVWYR